MTEKRPAEGGFGTTQLVKRQKSNADLGNENAVAVVNDSTKNGALIQSVSPSTYKMNGRRRQMGGKQVAMNGLYGLAESREAD